MTTTPEAARRFLHLTADGAWDLITQRLKDTTKPFALFDVRDEAAFAASRIDGAARLTERDFPAVFGRFPKDTPIVVYCYHGNASQTYAATFADFGFTEVYSVDGGFEALQAAHQRRAAAKSVATSVATASPEATAGLPQPNWEFQLGDMVFARAALHNDGGVPDLAPDALIAAAGARGVIVKVGHAEAAPEQTVYVVRFEDETGVLGTPIGCLPEELTQTRP